MDRTSSARYTTATASDPWYRASPLQPTASSAAPRWVPSALPAAVPTRLDGGARDPGSVHEGSSVRYASNSIDVDGWITSNRGTFLSQRAHDVVADDGFSSRGASQVAADEFVNQNGDEAAAADARHRMALLTAAASFHDELKERRISGRPSSRKPSAERGDDSAMEGVAHDMRRHTAARFQDQQPSSRRVASQAFEVHTNAEPASDTPPPPLHYPSHGFVAVETHSVSSASVDVKTLSPPRRRTPGGLVHSSRKGYDSESRQLQAPPYPSWGEESDDGRMTFEAAHRAAYGYQAVGAPGRLLPAPHEGLTERASTLAPALHEHLSVAGATAMAVRQKMLAARHLMALRAVEAAEATTRQGVRQHEDRSYDVVSCVFSELHHRLVAERHEASARELLATRLEWLNAAARQARRHVVALVKAEIEGRSAIMDQELDERLQRGMTARHSAAVASAARAPWLLAQEEAATRGQLTASFLAERGALLARCLVALEEAHRAMIDGYGEVTNFGRSHCVDHVLSWLWNGSYRPKPKALATPPYPDPVMPAKELNATLLQLRFGKSGALDRAVPPHRVTPLLDVDDLSRRGLQFVRGGGLGWMGFAFVMVPAVTFLLTETILRLAMAEAEERHRAGMVEWHHRQQSLHRLASPKRLYAAGVRLSASPPRSAAGGVASSTRRDTSSPPRASVLHGRGSDRASFRQDSSSHGPAVASPYALHHVTGAAPSQQPSPLRAATATATGGGLPHQPGDHDPETLFRLGDIENAGRLTLSSVVAVLRLVGIEQDLRRVAAAYNEAIDRRAAALRLTARETNRLRHHEGVDLLGFETIMEQFTTNAPTTSR